MEAALAGGLFAQDPQKAAGVAKARANAAVALARAEEEWLEASAAFEAVDGVTFRLAARRGFAAGFCGFARRRFSHACDLGQSPGREG